MSGNFSLDWLTLAVSLFNTILLLWLGLTVLLNAERRSWGIWMAGGGLADRCSILHDPHGDPGAGFRTFRLGGQLLVAAGLDTGDPGAFCLVSGDAMVHRLLGRA